MSEAAVQRGIFGSPFFLVDGEQFWGWDKAAYVGGMDYDGRLVTARLCPALPWQLIAPVFSQ